jgi:hypothetical protein
MPSICTWSTSNRRLIDNLRQVDTEIRYMWEVASPVRPLTLHDYAYGAKDIMGFQKLGIILPIYR